MADADPIIPPKPVIDAVYWGVASWVTQCFSVVEWLGAALTTLCIVLLFAYFDSKPVDPWYLKALAIFSCLLQCALSVFELLGHSIQLKYYAHQTIGPGMILPWTAAANVLVTCLSGLCAQVFFCRLVYQMMQSRRAPKFLQWLWLIVFTLLWLFIAAMGIATTVLFTMIPQRYWIPAYDTFNLNGQLPNVTYVSWLASTAVLDVILAVILVGGFVSDIRRGGFKDTNSALTSLAISTLETFSLTAVLASADAIMGGIYDTSKSPITQVRAVEVCYFLTIFCSRAYCISLLYTLRRRSLIRAQRFGSRAGGGSSGGETGASKRNYSSSGIATGVGFDRRRASFDHSNSHARVDRSYPPPLSMHHLEARPSGGLGNGRRIKVETQKQEAFDPRDEEAKEYTHQRGMHVFDDDDD